MFGEAPTGHHFDDNTFNETQSNDELDSSFTKTELRKVIFSLHNNKSPGLDSLTSEILKSAYDFISPFLLSLYNRMKALFLPFSKKETLTKQVIIVV